MCNNRIVVKSCFECLFLSLGGGNDSPSSCQHPSVDYEKHPGLLYMGGIDLNGIPGQCPLKSSFVEIVLAPIWQRKETKL